MRLAPPNAVRPVAGTAPEPPETGPPEPEVAAEPAGSLDPADWAAFRATAHRMLDQAIDFLQHVEQRPVWQKMPETVRHDLAEPPPEAPMPLDAVCRAFERLILPYAAGNIHPGFFGWVNGAGTPTGMVAEMLAAALNANTGGRDHGAVHVERQVIDWCRSLFGFPETAGGVIVSGSSTANLIGVLVARTARLGDRVHSDGVQGAPHRLTAYASRAAHACIAKAMDIAGLGRAALRIVDTGADHRIDLAALTAAIRRDRRDGMLPFLVVGTAGTVDIGAIDDLAALADLAAAEDLWFHVDGAFGALAVLSPALRPLVTGIERADSLGFDFHKWLHVPYDAGCVLIRDGDLHRRTFTAQAPYLTRMERGLGGGDPWFCDFGPELSRGFRALKVWFTLKEHGTARLGRAIARNCRQAHYLAERVAADPMLELLAPVPLNIVCFRQVRPGLDDAALDRLNRDIVIRVQESGAAAPSTTMIDGRLAIRACILNHRTRTAHLDRLLAAVRQAGDELAGPSAASVDPGAGV